MLRFLETISQQQPQRWSPKSINEYLFQFPPRDILQWNFQAEICKLHDQHKIYYLEEGFVDSHIFADERVLSPPEEYVARLAKEYDVDYHMIRELLDQHTKLEGAICD
jgi:hypothetical protein